MAQVSGPELREPRVDEGFLVAEVRISGLFGRYSYRISPLDSSAVRAGAPPLMLLYGGNGCGKTTILRLLWHLLSPSTSSGHRTYIARTPFSKLEVRLGNGDLIRVTKDDGLIGPFTVVGIRQRQKLFTEPYTFDIAENRVPVNRAGRRVPSRQRAQLEAALEADNFSLFDFQEASTDDAFIAYLSHLGARPFMLGDDREFYTDDPEIAEIRERQRRLPREGAHQSQTGAELAIAFRRTTEWLRQRVFTGAQAGSQSADQIYKDVLSQLAKVSKPEEAPSIEAIRDRLLELDRRSKEFSEFGLMPHAATAGFLNYLEKMDPSRHDLAASVLAPYIEGQNARLRSMQDTEELVRTFVRNINAYLTAKHVTFTPQTGLRVVTDEGAMLTPHQLSSGERQLLLLLCNALLARESTSLFLIDEPELSLNVKWQRSLLRTLLECVEGARVQFILASHSIEIISGHRQYLARLRSE